MSAESKDEQEHSNEIAQNKHQTLKTAKEIEFDDQRSYQDFHITPQESIESSTSLNKHLTNSTSRNKRKNFNPRPATIDIDNDTKSFNFKTMHSSPSPMSLLPLAAKAKSDKLSRESLPIFHPTTTPFESGGDFSSGNVSQLTQFNPWLQVLNHYEWPGRYGTEVASPIQDILKAYQSKLEWDSSQHNQLQDENGKIIGVNLSTDLLEESPIPPTNPPTISSMLANGSSPDPPANPSSSDECKQIPIKQEEVESASSLDKDSERILKSRNSNEDQHGEGSDGNEGIERWCDEMRQIDDYKTIKSTDDDDIETLIDDDFAVDNIYDEEDYPPRSPNDFTDSPNDEDDTDERIELRNKEEGKNNRDDAEDDDDDGLSVNRFCDDEQSETEIDGLRAATLPPAASDASGYTADFDADPDDCNIPEIAEKDGSTCSYSSSKLSVRNLGGFYDQPDQLNSNPFLKSRTSIDETTFNPDLIQTINKFTSYLDCQNEMCLAENLREHYHCHNYPCCGKVLSRKEEVIRHVKWHRKRMESLNHGFMRFSSSDDCSAIFGVNCHHNRKQTHYHCFQPNCDRVYVSTSDVQMHSNFHRKDSAIHKEGFQRFRANEKCNTDYCTFSGQKTTHFHCRRDDCRYTFKNKADMEKHKTYHIKDLKLARDGFKKFLKNEACPFSQCKFSKVCNHIHCSRKNCFYVLHSSGQLLSHKRKHDRIDSEQTYCRYKMLAVKATLMGNSAAECTSSETNSALNFSKSAMLDSGLKFPPNVTNVLSSSSSSPPPSSAAMSTEFLQQMKKRHEEILNHQRTHRKTNLLHDGGGGEITTRNPNPPNLNLHSTPNPNQYNTVRPLSMPSSLPVTQSVIQQFFTTKCPEKANKDISDCPCQDHSDPHLHCILKGCEAIVPNNILDISAHIHMHGYNRELLTPPVSHLAVTSSSSIEKGGSGSPMQITTIDGFFNRKRGRPPKNRFVEVYKNAQQSPQAIFTSFKLKKLTTSKENSEVPTQNLSYEAFKSANSTEQPLELQFKEDHIAPPSSSLNQQFVVYQQNENCASGSDASQCLLAMQHHYHCTCAPDCSFVTMERDLLSVHLERQHTAISFADTISKKFKRFDRNIGLDCGIFECRLRRTRPHLHCRQCYKQISPFDLESHVCALNCAEPTKQQPTPFASLTPPTDYVDNKSKIYRQESQIAGSNNSSRLPPVTFSTLNELRQKVSEMEPESSNPDAGLKRNHEEEKILVVRAAGTYFPENTSNLSNSPSPAQQQLKQQQRQTTTDSTGAGVNDLQSSPPACCSTPYCKKKRRTHDHCDTCDQAFVDPIKWRAHRLKHMQNSNLNESDESKRTNDDQIPPPLTPRLTWFDEQPQDLSLSPNTNSTTHETGPSITIPDQSKSLKESLPSSLSTSPSTMSTPAGLFLNLFPQNLMSSLSIQNFHLTQLATLYQQNPFYYEHLYPFISNTMPSGRNQQQQQQNRPTQPHPFRIPDSDEKLSNSYIPTPAASSGTSTHYPFLNPLLMVQQSSPITPLDQNSRSTSSSSSALTVHKIPAILNDPLTKTTATWQSKFEIPKPQKRKLQNGNIQISNLIDALSPATSTKRQVVQFPSVAEKNKNSSQLTSLATAVHNNIILGQGQGHGQNFKIRDEQIPNGYLKFRFNEDCYFPKCGYRNHQSHFHCDRNDCHYSFCDKTRFVQHTARHERLDKLMGNDFRQFRANMSCGYENCPYYKNLGSANKSSHFHCLKCEFICSDTNKVVAHRRQHNKMEYIRMAGFRKVTNSEKCYSTIESIKSPNGKEMPVECSYSKKQTHYHCLICDVSVLSRAQLGSHKHKA